MSCSTGETNSLRKKRRLSNQWLRLAVARGAACANLQVLHEITNVMLRKRADMTAAAVFVAVDELAFLGRRPVDDRTTDRARDIRLRTSYSWWDCLLLASALELGCRWFLSEDLQDGQTIEGLTIVDPFAHSPDQILTSL